MEIEVGRLFLLKIQNPTVERGANFKKIEKSLDWGLEVAYSGV